MEELLSDIKLTRSRAGTFSNKNIRSPMPVKDNRQFSWMVLPKFKSCNSTPNKINQPLERCLFAEP